MVFTTTAYGLICDRCHYTSVHTEPDRDYLLKVTTEQAWLHVDGKDYCPTCRPHTLSSASPTIAQHVKPTRPTPKTRRTTQRDGPKLA